MDDREDLTGYFEQGGALNYRHAPSDYGLRAKGSKAGRGGSRVARKSAGRGAGASSRSSHSSRAADTLFEQDQATRLDHRRLAPGERTCTQIYHYEGQTCLPTWSYESVKHLRRNDETFDVFRERMSVAMDTSSWSLEERHKQEDLEARRQAHSTSPGYLAFRKLQKLRDSD